MSKKFVVCTTINAPSEPLKEFNRRSDWTLVVVGDQKTPDDWHLPGAVYLSPQDQRSLSFALSEVLPWNHYSRKMLGYLFAMQQGATVIADTDDDNMPTVDWGAVDFAPSLPTIQKPHGFINIYRHFSAQHVWPRGLPLSGINRIDALELSEPTPTRVGVWQFLADGDPDVDAIYRLVLNQPVLFDDNPAVALDQQVWSPFNSQNTFFDAAVFPLLYLPAHVTIRFTDILRGFVAQPLLWKQRRLLAFGKATAFQDRNPHNYFTDFRSEIPMYLQTEVAAAAAQAAADDDLLVGLEAVYRELRRQDVVPEAELQVVQAWLDDVQATGWVAQP